MLVDGLLFLVGLAIGAINALAGGGMLIGFPVLLAAGLPPIAANASGKLVIVPGAIASSLGYRRFMKDLPKRYLWLLIPAVGGAAGGALLLHDTPGPQFEQIVPWLLLAAVIVFALRPFVRHKLSALHRATLLPLGVIGLILGGLSVYAGYFGAGFGFMVLALLSFSKLRGIHQLNSVKVLASAVTGVVGLIVLLPSGLFNWQAGLSMGAGNAIGGYLTARYAHAVPPRFIRAFVIVFGLAEATYLLLTS
jgi:uncharacterized membrane protein YfcA